MPATFSPDFDAYHKWLGIPPTDQPPHHYQLLGIAPYEADPEVIAAAADRQMAHVKSFASGQYAAASQALLNELARARVTLLNSRQKSVYDRALYEQLQRRDDKNRERVVQERPAQPVVRSTALDAHEYADFPSLRHARSTAYRRKQTGHPIQTFLLVIGLTSIAAALFYAAAMQLPSDGGRETSTPDSAQANVRIPSTKSSKSAFPRNSRIGRNKEDGEQPLAGVIAEPPSHDADPAIAPPQAPNQPPVEALAQSAVAHVIDVDLKNRRQRYLVGDAKHKQFRMVSFRGCKVPYLIKSDRGVLDEKSKASIIVSGVREAVFEIAVDTNSQGKTSLIVEYNVINDAGEDVPFTLSTLDRVCRKITKDGQQAASSMDAMFSERRRLQAWISAPVVKPLVARGQAQARVAELGILMSEESRIVESLRADLGVAQKLFELATQIDEECAIEIAVIE